jgi:type IV pilus assembly protein PilV
MKRSTPSPSLQQRGISMIEVLIGVLLISVALLGLVSLQARAFQFSVDSEDSARASLLASELATAMTTQGTVNLPAATVSTWNTRVGNMANGGLPNGTGTVTVTGATARITVTWQPPKSSASNQYQTDVTVTP